MNTMKWLVKREFWEHKGGFFWAPVWVGAIVLLFFTATVFGGILLGQTHGFNIDGDQLSVMSKTMTPDERNQFAEGIAKSYMGLATPLYMVLSVTVFFFCLGALFDDRKDRSVLFWKSLPVSDGATVLSKVAIALLAAPLITIALAIVVSVLVAAVICIAAAMIGINVIAPVLANPQLYLSPFEVVAILPVYALWALPTVGWLMMVSSWARTKPFLWAVGLPVISGLMVKWFDVMFGFGWNIGWFWKHIVGRGLGGTIPGIWFTYYPAASLGETVVDTGNGMSIHHHSDDMGALMVQSWHVLATPDVWIGAIAGCAMIIAAIRLRRWRDEG